MSHIVEVRTEVRDIAAVKSACRRRKLAEPTMGTFQLFTTKATGLGVQLPQWRFPIVIDLPNGRVSYDNFEGRWGKPEELNRFLQAYAVEKATLESRKAGHSVHEKLLDDGSVKLTVMVAGGAA